MSVSNVCDEMMSVCSVKVIDPSIRQQICSLQGHHFPRFTQSSVCLSPSPPQSRWDLTIALISIKPSGGWHHLLCHQAFWLAETVRKCSQTQTHTFIWRCGTINRRDEASRDQILSTETSTAQRSRHGTYNHCSNDQLSGASHSDPQGKFKIQEDFNIVIQMLSLFMSNLNSRIRLLITFFFLLQLRKPLVEKLRRERINSSIEQIKSLLGPEFLKQQPDSKLEKADILEMTVCVLRRLQQQNEKQRRLLNHVNKMQCSSDKNLREADFSLLSSTVQTSINKEKSPVNSVPWRPW